MLTISVVLVTDPAWWQAMIAALVPAERPKSSALMMSFFDMLRPLLVIGYWLLVIGYWLLVIGYWLLVICEW